MNEWRAVMFGQARQVAQLMQSDEEDWPPLAVDVRAGYATLRARDDLPGAIDYLAHALPRFEAVAWAAHLLDAQSRVRPLASRDRRALDTAMRWVGEPTDAHRRATRDAALAAGPRSAERFLGLAVFHVGGSIAAPGLPPILPPQIATPRYAAGAIKQAGYRTGALDAFFSRALHVGETVAERGAAALAELGA